MNNDNNTFKVNTTTHHKHICILYVYFSVQTNSER